MKSRNHKKSKLPALCISLAVSLGMLTWGMAALDEMTADVMGERLVIPLIRLLHFITIGLAVGQVIEATGWTLRLGMLGAPLFRFARMGTHCSAAFSVAFVSGATANALLYDFWKDGKINRYQVIMTNLANQLPAFFLHLPTTMFIVLPLTGLAGVHYFLLTFLAAILRLMLVLLWGRWHPADQGNSESVTPGPDKQAKERASMRTLLSRKLPKRLMAVATYVVPIYIAVFLLNRAGLFDWARQWMVRWVVTGFVPVESLSLVVLSFAAEFSSGFAAAGALLQQGLLTTKQAVVALLIGNVVAFPIRALRHQLPRLMGIFAPKLGMQILMLGQGFRITSLILVGGLYYMIL